MKRLLSTITLALLVPPHFVSAAETTRPADRPNILIMLADDMGYSDLGCYGGEIATPNLDALAKGGLRFTQFYNAARCWPTRAAILTGYYAQQVRRDTVPGVKSGGGGVRPPWARLLPEMLKPLGYRSYHSGKWHVDGQPLQNGFNHSYRLEDHDRNFAPRRHFEDDEPLPPVETASGYYTSTAIANHAIKCLKEHAEKYAAQPFFEFLAFTSPHFPLQAPEEDIARYRDKYLRGWDVMRDERWRRMQALGIGGNALSAVEREVGPPYQFPDALKKLGANEVNRPLPWSELNPAQREFQANKMAVHAAMVDRMDREIGRVLDQIRAMGQMDKTLVFFLSDNGASAEMMVRGDGHDPDAACGTGATFLCLGPGWSSMANTPFRRHKTWVHEGGISTPLIVHWARGNLGRGELRHTPGHVIDLMPTILQLAGGKPFETWQGQPMPPPPGKSLAPVFAKDGPQVREALWWLHEGNRALRAGDWKIVAAGKDAPWELYDLSADRSESRNLAGEKPEKARELSALWERMTEQHFALARQDLPRAGVQAPTVTVSSVRRVFHNGEHNAFTDLCQFRGQLYLTFRSCPDGHMVHPTASIIVLRSADGAKWDEVHRFRVEQRDTRDPHFLVFGDKLFVYTGTWYSGKTTLPRDEYDMNKHLGFAAWSEDGTAWHSPIMLEGTFGHYIWRAASFGDKAYLCGRRKLGFEITARGEPASVESLMLESDDGLNWRKRAVFQETAGDETAFLFESDGSVLGVARNGTGKEARLLRSRPPYTTWERKNLDRSIGGPLLTKWGDRYVVGGRKSTKESGPKTSLCWLVGDRLVEFAELPSGGDNSYPGFVARSATRALVSYYSSHERDAAGHPITAIYLAELSQE
ncbi:MAG: arylsulfatase [Verrucomicrobia bacterium]|nr:arylsulfatase [Verrucomicrobiota bacterium]